MAKCIKCKKREGFKHGDRQYNLCSICALESLGKPLPNQYKKQTEALIHEIGQLADKLYPFITELGDNVEIECGECMVIIKKCR